VRDAKKAVDDAIEKVEGNIFKTVIALFSRRVNTLT